MTICPRHYQSVRLFDKDFICLGRNSLITQRSSIKFGGFSSCYTSQYQNCPEGYAQTEFTDGVCPLFICTLPETPDSAMKAPEIKPPPYFSYISSNKADSSEIII